MLTAAFLHFATCYIKKINVVSVSLNYTISAHPFPHPAALLVTETRASSGRHACCAAHSSIYTVYNRIHNTSKLLLCLEFDFPKHLWRQHEVSINRSILGAWKLRFFIRAVAVHWLFALDRFAEAKFSNQLDCKDPDSIELNADKFCKSHWLNVHQ